MDVIAEATRTGAAPNISDAYTINGQPGDFYNCSSQGMLLLLLFLQPDVRVSLRTPRIISGP